MAIKFTDPRTLDIIKRDHQKISSFNKDTIALGEAMKTHDLVIVPKTAKSQVTIRLDDDVLAALRATGKGWQSTINATLRKALKLSDP